MQLLYTWRDKTITTKGNIQEINYSTDFDISFNEETYTIEISKIDKPVNIYKNDVIQNFNLIIGSNGSGKTTLLNFLHSRDKYNWHNKPKESYILAYYFNEHEAEFIQIETNLDQPLNFSKTNLNFIQKDPSSDNDDMNGYTVTNIRLNLNKATENFIPSPYIRDRITPVYLSNSQFDILPFIENSGNKKGNGSSTKRTRDSLSLTPSNHDLILNPFYFDEKYPPENDDSILRRRFEIQKKNRPSLTVYFKYIKMLYYFNILNEEKKDFFIKSIEPLFNIKCQSFPTSDDNHKLSAFLRQKHTLKEWFHIQMLIEIYLISSPSPSIDMRSDVEKTLRSIIKTLDSREKDYYEEELKIIDDFFDLPSIKFIKEIHEKKEMSDSILSFNAIKDNRVTSDIIQFISTHSWQDCFLIRIMEITSIPFSAGERAVLELFSQLSFALNATHSDKAPRLNQSSIGDNVLLLVDEVDLYLNPEWQRMFMKIFYAEITNIFKEKKVHVIITTHSPIVLSDFTSQHVIALKDGKQEKDFLKTFGSSIHTLFKEGFFLDSTVGSFSNNAISNIIKKIDNSEILNKIDNHIIDEIGDPLIKNLILQRKRNLENKDDFQKELIEKIKKLEDENLHLQQEVEVLKNDKN